MTGTSTQDPSASDHEPALSATKSPLARFFVPKNSARDELVKDLQDPFRRPERFGWLRYWWDESPHSMAVSLMLFLLLLLLTLTTGLGDRGKKKIPSVGVEQVVLGTSLEDLSDLDSRSDAIEQVTSGPRSPVPVDSIVGPKGTEPTGKLPTDKPYQPASDPSEPDLSQDKIGLENIQLPAPSTSGGSGGVGLTGIFNIEKSIGTVVYVIDKSSSMGGMNRLDRVKAELIHGIENLSAVQRFSVVFYNETAWPLYSQRGIAATSMSGRLALLQATDENKRKVIDWVRQIYPGGGTNPFPATMIALGVNPELIMLLSDGEFDPSYVHQITQSNQQKGSKKARIDCVGIGESIRTLQGLAKVNGGIYYPAR